MTTTMMKLKETTITEKISAEIQKGDFKEILGNLETGTADLILTDPPYTISRATGFANSGKNGVDRFAVSMDFGEWDHDPIDIDDLSKEMLRVLRKGGTAIVWYDIWKTSHLADAMTKAGFKMLRLLIWEKKNPVPLNMKSTYLSNAREMAVVGVKGGKPTFKTEYHKGVYDYPIPRHNGHRIHPTQKPIDLFSELVEIHSDIGDLIIDPFLGSGTTAVAAKKLGRHFYGGDIDADYVKAAQQRLHSEL